MRTHIAGGKWAEVAIIAQPSLGIGVGGRISDSSKAPLMEERKPVGLPSPLVVEVLGVAHRQTAGEMLVALVEEGELQERCLVAIAVGELGDLRSATLERWHKAEDLLLGKLGIAPPRGREDVFAKSVACIEARGETPYTEDARILTAKPCAEA